MFTGLGTIVSSTPQGNYTLVTDEYGEQGLVNTNQWNEYQLLLQQGSPKVSQVWLNGSSSGYYGIIAYQLQGQQKVTLLENAVIKVTDNYNLDHLSVLKYLGNQLGSQYLFNVNQELKKEEQKIIKERSAFAQEQVKKEAEYIKERQEIEEAYKANEEKNVLDKNDKHYQRKQTYLKYSRDYLQNYSSNNLKKSQSKIWASFDNERNYIQQWLNKHNLTLKQLRDMRYTTENLDENVKKYGKQMVQADTYFKWIENGTLPKNCSYGDWIRYMLRPGNMMPGWNWLAIWSDNVDFGPQTGASGNGWVTYKDTYDNNREIQKMLEEDLPIITNLPNLSKEEELQMVESLCGASSFIDPFGSNIGKNVVIGWKSMSEIKQEILNKWNTEYLPNIKD